MIRLGNKQLVGSSVSIRVRRVSANLVNDLPTARQRTF